MPREVLCYLVTGRVLLEALQGSECVDGRSCDQNDPGCPHLALKIRPRNQDEDEAGKCKQYRQGIERHAESADLAFAAMFGEERGCSLQQELKQDSNDHQRCDDLLQPKDAAEQCNAAQELAASASECGASDGGLQTTQENCRRVPRQRGFGNIRAAKRMTEARAARAIKTTMTRGRGVAVELLHEDCHGEHASVAVGILSHLAPGQNAEHADVHQQIEGSDDRRSRRARHGGWFSGDRELRRRGSRRCSSPSSRRLRSAFQHRGQQRMRG